LTLWIKKQTKTAAASCVLVTADVSVELWIVSGSKLVYTAE